MSSSCTFECALLRVCSLCARRPENAVNGDVLVLTKALGTQVRLRFFHV